MSAKKTVKGNLRTKVLKFAIGMDDELDANAYKDAGGKEGWHECPPLYLEKKLLEEVAELIFCTTGGISAQTAEYWASIFKEQIRKAQAASHDLSNKNLTKKKAYDTANVSMMLADNNGGL